MIAGEETATGPIIFVSCHTLNTLTEGVLVPKAIIDYCQKATNIDEILWPLGAYVGFTVEGLSLGLYGRGKNGEILHGISQVPMNPHDSSQFGEVLHASWLRLRGTPAFVTQANYETLLKRTQERHKLVP